MAKTIIVYENYYCGVKNSLLYTEINTRMPKTTRMNDGYIQVNFLCVYWYFR